MAGEHSGDQLGAALIAALRARVPAVQCFGVAGPKMIAAGCEAWASSEQLGVMGLAEVLRHLPRLLRLRAGLVRRFLAARPDVFVGIDAPEFNLGLARRLKGAGIRTVQYVSPQVWAWRQGRVRKIGAACDLVLCLFPFETEFYTQPRVAAQFVGHPLADQIPVGVDREGARRALGIDPGATLIALLPGSRLGEVRYLAAPFASAAARLSAQRPRWQFIAPMASAAARERFLREIAQVPAVPEIRLVEGEAHTVLAACDAALVASGTATLETLLSGRPMVVAYRASPVTAFVMQYAWAGQGAILFATEPARRPPPRSGVSPGRGGRRPLGAALLHELEDPEHVRELLQEFATVHRALRCGGAGRAADAILELCAGARSAGAL